MENLAELKGVSKQFPGFVLDGLNLTLPSGSIVGLIGENGAGKTTTLKILLGLLRPDAGQTRLLGKPISPETLSQVGVVWEDSYFDGNLSPTQIGKVMAGICPGWDASYYQSLCRRFTLPADQKNKEFSRGMRMKLSLSTALARHPKLLVMDEPTSGLDPVVRGEILDIFLEFIQSEEQGILLSSHITSDLEKIADEIAYIHKGKLLFQRNKDDLLESMAILRCPENMLDSLPKELVIARQKGRFGAAALVQEPEVVRSLVPSGVIDRASLDDMMQFVTGRDSQ